MTAPNDKPTADARTVLPGQPVRYHGGIMLGTPITAPEPDPSQIVGVVTFGTAAPEPESPSIPPPGFYWARIDGDLRWVVVEVSESRQVYVTAARRPVDVTEWGPRIEPPDSAPQRLLSPEEAGPIELMIHLAAEVGRSPISYEERDRLVEALARVTAP